MTTTFKAFEVGTRVTMVRNGTRAYDESHGVILELIDGGTAIVQYDNGMTPRIPLRKLQHRVCESWCKRDSEHRGDCSWA